VAEQFYELCEYARQEGFTAVQQELFNLLTEDSQAALADCAAKVAAKLDNEGKPGPGYCLVFDSYHGTKGQLKMKRVHSGNERVRLKITSNGTSRALELVLEDEWRIDLQSTIALNADMN